MRSSPGKPGPWSLSTRRVYLDAIWVKIRDGAHVRNKAAHIAIGVDMEGIKHVLGIWIQASEGGKILGKRMRRISESGVGGCAHRRLRWPQRLPRGDRGDLAKQHRSNLRCAFDSRSDAVCVLQGP